jgi:hypothetical protein
MAIPHGVLQKLLFVVEVVMDGSLGDSGAVSNFFDGDGVKSLCKQNLEGCFLQFQSSDLADRDEGH